jgi:hypothetical protein
VLTHQRQTCLPHSAALLAVSEQSCDNLPQLLFIAHLQRCPRIYCEPGSFVEIEGVGADDDRRADGTSLEQILAAKRQKTSTDKGEVARCVVREQLAHAVTQNDGSGCGHRPPLAAALVRQRTPSEHPCDGVEPLRMPWYDHCQQLAVRGEFRCRQYLFLFPLTRAGGHKDRASCEPAAKSLA